MEEPSDAVGCHTLAHENLLSLAETGQCDPPGDCPSWVNKPPQVDGSNNIPFMLHVAEVIAGRRDAGGLLPFLNGTGEWRDRASPGMADLLSPIYGGWHLATLLFLNSHRSSASIKTPLRNHLRAWWGFIALSSNPRPPEVIQVRIGAGKNEYRCHAAEKPCYWNNSAAPRAISKRVQREPTDVDINPIHGLLTLALSGTWETFRNVGELDFPFKLLRAAGLMRQDSRRKYTRLSELSGWGLSSERVGILQRYLEKPGDGPDLRAILGWVRDSRLPLPVLSQTWIRYRKGELVHYANLSHSHAKGTQGFVILAAGDPKKAYRICSETQERSSSGTRVETASSAQFECQESVNDSWVTVTTFQAPEEWGEPDHSVRWDQDGWHLESCREE